MPAALPPIGPLDVPLGALLVVATVVVVTGALHLAAGLHRPAPFVPALEDLPRLLAHAVLAWCVGCALVAALRPDVAPGARQLLALIAAHTVLAWAGRAAVLRLRGLRARREPRPLVVVGAGRAARRIAAVLRDHPEYGLRPVARVADGDAGAPGPGAGEPGDLPVLPPVPRELDRLIGRYGPVDALFTHHPAGPGDAALLRRLWERGGVAWLVEVDPVPHRPLPVGPGGRGAHLWGHPCHRLDPPPRRRAATAAKRTVDLLGASLGLLLAAPLLVGCALAVRLADGPGVIFRQERVGRDGRPFVLYKFRTLRPDDDREAATRWSVADDRRMSRVGRMLRRTSLDELPQLWNVLRGEMSLVGPRPERPHFVERFGQAYPGYAERHRMPVGLTGLAQTSGLRGDTSIEDRARFDNHYIETWSLWRDLRILVRTAVDCVRCKGA
ncbi:exopolysaccharide biosynthesis polyprenyl glycosylphosphotransferase [Streptomyces calidiresistens]|uniref:Exopolysaccharide biosynthesis polyprenyl glycosylphosphotransferase n=1 Tax=Streptomyces calidiresistens TaxID=1485586 RepID=A0A7W3XZ88_9ACTN|nr:exopolysaccharide biosynthesis polyprenyl glycosylphosphotransferase [Streptomyces calidiresistens]MBB0232642.1 exopolysaccharide biosynthesis polyprenyl glycosylphosphotransferase [Streptomyces calidiresistens]